MHPFVKKWVTVYLKCGINLILYYRNVYPAASFDLTTFQGFNLPQFMPMNRHPAVLEYIDEFIEDVLFKLQRTHKITLCIITPKDYRCIETYTFDFRNFNHLGVEDPQKLREADVYDRFRASLNNLIQRLEKLTPIKDDSVSFELVATLIGVELGHTFDKINHFNNNFQKLFYERDMNWVKCQPEDPYFNESMDSEKVSSRIRTHAIIGANIGPISIDILFERLLVWDGSLDTVYEYEDDYYEQEQKRPYMSPSNYDSDDNKFDMVNLPSSI
ncbi:hypothetical protein TBLA_0J02040 [Henningerozyma blattae CBS 6284]|uniref:HORMA domain-containing protein n=1 Tax=Henningerozyma blattae (strain ATCC 34711 / CBS 6284 / DSM 70876 / NBRC 10599 / NRRL Y-10934 / UCD 77-7) TaxID=1071380 RepID=I2H9Z6_HENB6|nr:hypothetical protein TBLA_0J02040 [Tetrapisispora blattae CBS 6284]CCH63198.1 hypothetical protein TBLA_0J02040 [Tetrapisispora blattae CBS 6284]